MPKDFDDFVLEVRKWDIGQSSKTKEQLILWGRALAKNPSLPPEFVAEYDYLLQGA